MNNALTHIPAAASALFSGKYAFVRAIVLGCAVACASAPVLAQQDRDQRNGGQQQAPGREQPRQERAAPPPPRQYDSRQFDTRQYDTRQSDARAEEQRRQAQAQEQGGRRGGRLTPDERRELRRQINDAGIDLYPNPPHRYAAPSGAPSGRAASAPSAVRCKHNSRFLLVGLFICWRRHVTLSKHYLWRI
jgi:hypothetical protein